MNFLKRVFDRWSGRAPVREDDAPIVLRVAEIFGDYPGQRGGADIDLMKMALADTLNRAERQHTHVILDLDNVRGGYSSGFLHKVFSGFGGEGFYLDACCGEAPKLRFKSGDDPSLALEICGYLNENPNFAPARHFHHDR